MSLLLDVLELESREYCLSCITDALREGRGGGLSMTAVSASDSASVVSKKGVSSDGRL